MQSSELLLHHFPIEYKEGNLYIEDKKLADIAKTHGTPCYVYSKNYITKAYESFKKAFAEFPNNQILYAVKANSNIGILSLFAKLGSGFDIVSQGELFRVLKAGGKAENVIFSGVGKTEEEIAYALEKGVKCFNIESESELYRIDRVAGRLGKKAPVSFRINPDVDSHAHEKTSTGKKEHKFGIARERALFMYREAAKCQNIEIKGIDAHIGSQITEVDPFPQSLDVLLEIVDQLKQEGIHLKHIDIGGGLGIYYGKNRPEPPSIESYAAKILEKMRGRTEGLLFEPGRFLIGNAGLLLANVEFLKHHAAKNFAIIDAAMNDLIRPTLYSAYHEIINTRQAQEGEEKKIYDVVGPVCETGDFIGLGRELQVKEGDLLAVLSAGAYGMSMVSNYNSRLKPAEIMIDGSTEHVIREREKYDDLIQYEKVPNF